MSNILPFKYLVMKDSVSEMKSKADYDVVLGTLDVSDAFLQAPRGVMGDLQEFAWFNICARIWNLPWVSSFQWNNLAWRERHHALSLFTWVM